jgi:hypothetical protein
MSSPFLDLVGSGFSAIGKLQAASQAAGLDKIQAQIYATNAGIDQGNAASLESQATVAAGGEGVAAAEGNLNVARIQEQGRQVLAQQRSYFSSTNVDPTYGSPLLTMARTASRVASDVDIARASAAISSANAQASSASLLTSAAGQQGQALGALLQESGAKQKEQSDMVAGFFGAATALLSGTSSAFSSFGGGDSGGPTSTIQVGSQSFPAFQ